jgi:hypothetical protein
MEIIMSKILSTAAAIIILGVTATGAAQARDANFYRNSDHWAQNRTQAQPHYTWRYYGGPKSGPLWPSVTPQQGGYGFACDMPDSTRSNSHRMNG